MAHFTPSDYGFSKWYDENLSKYKDMKNYDYSDIDYHTDKYGLSSIYKDSRDDKWDSDVTDRKLADIITSAQLIGNLSHSNATAAKDDVFGSLSDILQRTAKRKEADEKRRKAQSMTDFVDIKMPCWVGFEISSEMMGMVRDAYENAGAVGNDSYYVIKGALDEWNTKANGVGNAIKFGENHMIWQGLERHRFNDLMNDGGIHVPVMFKSIDICDVNVMMGNLTTPLELTLSVRCGSYFSLAKELMQTAGRFCITGQGEVSEDKNGRREISSFMVDKLFYYGVDGNKVVIV